jgi:hypothetical protein
MNAGGEEVVAEDNFNGFKQKFSAIINNGGEVLDGMDDIVLFVESNDGTKYVLGAKYGLWKTSQAAMSNDNLGTTAVEFASREGMEEPFGDYYLTADISTIPTTTNYEAIEGLTISNGSVTPKRIYLKIPSGICYAVLPNGAVITSSAGIIDYDYTGTGGNILFVVPKNSNINLSNVVTINEIRGTLNTKTTGVVDMSFTYIDKAFVNNCTSFIANGSQLMTFNSSKSINNSLVGCYTTAQSIGDFLLDAIANNRTYAGVFTSTGGGNAGSVAINTYLISRGTTLAAVLTQLATWTITLNA